MARFKVVDSDRDVTLPQHTPFAIVYEPHWQRLRSSLEGFTEWDISRKSMAKLEVYSRMGTSEERVYRLWRVRMLMSAIPVGQPQPSGLQLVPFPVQKAVIAYRKQITKRYKALDPPTFWDWGTVREEIIAMCAEPLGEAFLVTLARRFSAGRAMRNQPKRELRYFLSLIGEQTHYEYRCTANNCDGSIGCINCVSATQAE